MRPDSKLRLRASELTANEELASEGIANEEIASEGIVNDRAPNIYMYT